MKLLVIASNQMQLPWPVIPFGACSVAAAARSAGHEVEVLDLCFVRNNRRAIEDTLSRFVPDVVGVSIRNIDNSDGFANRFFIPEVLLRTIEPLKRAFKGPIIIGGPAVGINAAELLTYFDLEFAAVGDGEPIIVSCLEHQAKGLYWTGIPGLVIRDRATGHVTPAAPCAVEDLNQWVPPKVYEFIDLASYRKFDSPLQIQTKRGCSLGCVYCTYNNIEGHAYRFRDPDAIADYLETIVKETGLNHIEITDSTFNIPLDHAKRVLRAIIARRLNLRLRAMGLNPKAVDEELADLLREAGFMDVDLGVEAASDPALKSLGKNFLKSDVIRAAQLLHSRRIPINWYLLLGAPAETETTVLETLDTVSKAARNGDFLTIAVGIRIYQGSPIALEERRKNPRCTSDGFLSPMTLEPAGISLERISLLCQIAGTRNPNFFIYGPEENIPIPLLRSLFFLQSHFFPRIPIWKLQTLRNRLLTLMGVKLLKRIRLERRLAALPAPPAREIPSKRAA